MNLRTKFALFFVTLIILLIGGLVYYFNFYISGYLKRNTMNDFRIIAELSKSAYFTFTDLVKTRAVDWSSDGYIRTATEKIIAAGASDNDNEYQADTRALGEYLSEEKMKYGPNIIIADILDGHGVVVASSREDRVGIDEKAEEEKLGAHRFSDALSSKQLEAFVSYVVFEEDESDKPMIHAVTRLFSFDKNADGSLIPLDAVLLLHFSNTDTLGEILSGRHQVSQGALSGRALYERYKTADIYLVNEDHLMISPAQGDHNVILRQRVDTAPVHNCFNDKKEIIDEYISYENKMVIGASICLTGEKLTLVAEVESEEVLKPISLVRRTMTMSGIAAGLIGALALIFSGNWFLKPLTNVTDTAREVARGNLGARAPVKTKDEIGRLAETFNGMLENISQSNEKIMESRRKTEAAAQELKQKVAELEKFKKMTVDRELKMAEMKKEIGELKNKKTS